MFTQVASRIAKASHATFSSQTVVRSNYRVELQYSDELESLCFFEIIAVVQTFADPYLGDLWSCGSILCTI